MGLTLLRNDDIRKSDAYDDSVQPSEANFETSASNLGDDLNTIRSALRNILQRDGSSPAGGKWYDDIDAPGSFEDGKKRGLNALNSDLHGVQRKRILSMLSQIVDITVPSASMGGSVTYNDPVGVTVKPGGSIYTVGSGGDYATLQDALASPSVVDGDNLVIYSGTYVISSTITVSKQVAILGEGPTAASVVFETAGTGADPVLMFDVTVSNVWFSAITFTHKLTTDPGGIGTCVKLSGGSGQTGIRFQTCEFQFIEFGLVISSDSYEVYQCHFKYRGPNNSTRRAIGIYRSAVSGLIVSNTVDTGMGGAVTGNTRFIQVTSTTGLATEVLGGYLRIGYNTQSGAATIHQFMNVDWFGAGATPLQLVVDHNSMNETSAFVVFAQGVAQPTLSQCSSIALISNTLSNVHGKGALAMNGSSGTGTLGTTTFYANGNTITNTSYIGNFVTAIDGSSDVAVLAQMGYDTTRWADPNQTISPTAADQNYVVLGVGEFPSVTTAAVGSVQTRGSVVAEATTFGAHCLDVVSGASALQPKNLCLVVDGDTHDPILSDNRVVYALLQSENGTDGHTISASAGNRVQLSFVRINADGDDLEAVPASDIAGMAIHYSNVVRKAFEDLNEQDFLTSQNVDVLATATVTQQAAWDNQGATAITLTTDATTDLGGAALEYSIRDLLSAPLFTITEGSGTASSEVAVNADVDTFTVDAVNTSFANGATFGTSGTGIQVAETAGTIERAGDLTIFASGGDLLLTDSYNAGSAWSASAVKLAASSAEWDAYKTAFGEVSLLNAIEQASNVAATPAGNDMELQYNNGGSFGASVSFTYSDALKVLTISDESDSLAMSPTSMSFALAGSLDSGSSLTLGGTSATSVSVGNGAATASILGSSIQINSAYYIPTADGTANQVLTTDGAGNVTFQDAPSVAPARLFHSVLADVAADNNVGGPSTAANNLSVDLPDGFVTAGIMDTHVFMNGRLLQPGADASANNDYYPGTSFVAGNVTLRFERGIRTGDIIASFVY